MDPGIALRVLNFAPRWRSASSPSRFSFAGGDAGNRWIRDSASLRAILVATETRKISCTCRETNFDSCYPSGCFDTTPQLKGDSSLILSDAYKIVSDVEGKRGDFLFGCVRRAVHLKKSETMREYHVTVLIYRKWKSCLILRTSYF